MIKRIIPRLDVKSRKLIKGIRMEGLRVVGDPLEKISEYYNDGADEIIYSDIVSSLYKCQGELMSKNFGKLPITLDRYIFGRKKIILGIEFKNYQN